MAILKCLTGFILALYILCAQAFATPRGLNLNALLNDRFPVKEAADILSIVPEPAFSFVYKSFGDDWQNLYSLLDSLANSPGIPPRHVTVLVYLDCGPCRYPRRPRGEFKLIAPSYDGAGLNRGLERNDQRLTGLFTGAITDLYSRLPVRQGVQYIISNLEDGFTQAGFRHLRTLLVLGRAASRGDVIFGRNPGSDVRVYGIDEVHSGDVGKMRSLKRGDIFSNDGFDVGSGLYARRLLAASSRRRVIFLLYRARTQGLTSKPNSVFLPPDKREYSIPDIQQTKRLLKG